MTRTRIAIPLLLLLSVSATAELTNDGVATAEEVVAKVTRAAYLIRLDAKSGIDAVASPSGEFVWKDSYVFVVDCEADQVLANPAFPERVGGDIKQHTDYAGYRYGLALCDTASGSDGGWVEYVWLRPGSTAPTRKSSYVRSVPGTTYQVGAGIYGVQIAPENREE